MSLYFDFDFGFGLWVFSRWFNFKLIFWVWVMGFLWILGRSSLIFIIFWVSIVLTSFGGGGWVVMVGRCGVDGGIYVLVVMLLQV